MLHFRLLNLYLNFYLNSKYKLCFILVYRNCFSCQTIKTTFSIFLLGFSLAHLSKLTRYINRCTSQAIILVLSELVTPEVLQVKNRIVYFDHDNNMPGINWDDIVANPVASLPEVNCLS